MADLNSATTTAAFADFDTETVTVQREAAGASPGQFTYSTIYSGPADVQSGTGSTFMQPNGVTMTADAEMSLEPVAGVLPAIQAGDLVTWNGQKYTIAQTSPWTYPIKHVTALLKLGVLNMKPKK